MNRQKYRQRNNWEMIFRLSGKSQAEIRRWRREFRERFAPEVKT